MRITCLILIALIAVLPARAQRGDIVIAAAADLHVPTGAVICADRIYANNPGYGRLSIGAPQCLCPGMLVIPVELRSFSVVEADGAALLTWTTESESRCHGFEPQRSTEPSTWISLGFVEGHGSSTLRHAYRFVDHPWLLSGGITRVRYRLRQLDFDGGSEYSPEVELLRDAASPDFTLAGYPSPCDERLTVRVTNAGSGVLDIRLYDVTGRVAVRVAGDAMDASGGQGLYIRTADLPAGVYLLVARSGEGVRSRRVVIRH